MITVIAAIAQNFSDVTSEKTKVGIESARQRGATIGQQRRVPADLVKRIVQMYKKGMRVGKIASALTRRG